jgi:hypothetical protein
MDEKTESMKKSKREKWHYLFKMDKRVGSRYYIHKYYVNSDMNKIKEIMRHNKTIITCPIYFDKIILKYLCKNSHNILITWRLVEIINNMFSTCNKDCSFWKEWLSEFDIARENYNRKGYQMWMEINPKMIDFHDSIFNLYDAKDWQEEANINQ